MNGNKIKFFMGLVIALFVISSNQQTLAQPEQEVVSMNVENLAFDKESANDTKVVDHVLVFFTNADGNSDGAYLSPGMTHTIRPLEGTSVGVTIYASSSTPAPHTYYLYDYGNGKQHTATSSNTNFTFNTNCGTYNNELCVGPDDTSLQAFVDNISGMVTVDIYWVGNSPEIELSDDAINFGSSSTYDTFEIRNQGQATLTYSFSTPTSWIDDINPPSGTSNGEWDEIEVEIDRSGMLPGSYMGWIYVTSDGGNETIDVSMTVPVPQTPPTASIVSPVSSTPSFDFGSSVNFEARGTDTGNDLIGCEWTVSGASSGEYNDNGWSVTGNRTSYLDWDFVVEGTHIVQARFYDSSGLSASVSWNVYIQQRPIPVVVLADVQPLTCEVGEQFNIEITGANGGISTADFGGIAVQIRNTSGTQNNGDFLVDDNSVGANGSQIIFQPGDDIWNGPQADYLHVEPNWGSWALDVEHTLSAVVTPNVPGTYEIYYKMYLNNDELSVGPWIFPGGSENLDHQDEGTVKYGTLSVVETNSCPEVFVSGITQMPSALWPGGIFSVVTEYHDQNGSEDLKFCDLAINNPLAGSIRMRWDQSNGQVENLSTNPDFLYFCEAEVEEDLGTGYRIKWWFVPRYPWVESASGVSFATWAQDDGMLECADWATSVGGTSFIEPPTPVTVITHGFLPIGSNAGDWERPMADAMIERIGGGRIWDYMPGIGTFFISTDTGNPGPDIYLFPWPESSTNVDGLSEAAADALTSAVLGSRINNGLPFDNFHLIGHSRGAVIVSEVAERLLVHTGATIQLTTLDPHDSGLVDICDDFDVNWSISPPRGVAAWQGLEWADNYYQTDWVELHGIFVPGATNLHMDFSPPVSHSEVHEWYYNTIDLNAGGVHVGWYLGENIRYLCGYNKSKIGGQSRAANGNQPIDYRLNSTLQHFSDSVNNGAFQHKYRSPNPPNVNFTIPGWEFHAGGGIIADSLEKSVRLLGASSFIAHNIVFIPDNTEYIQFTLEVKNVSSVDLDMLQIEFGGYIQDGQYQGGTTSNSQRVLLDAVHQEHIAIIDVPVEFKGKSTTFCIRIRDVDDPLGEVDSEVVVDNFELLFSSPPILPEVPDPSLPEDGYPITSLEPHFEWLPFAHGGDGESQIGYQLRVRRNSDDTIVYDTGFISSTGAHAHDYSSGSYTGPDDVTEVEMVSEPLDPNTTYHWHVRYRDSGGDWGGWSADQGEETHWDFTTPHTLPVVTLLEGVPSSVDRGTPFTLNANINPGTDTLLEVVFYRETNGTSGLQLDDAYATGDMGSSTDSNGSETANCGVNVDDIEAGQHAFYALARTQSGLTSGLADEAALCLVNVNNALPMVAGLEVAPQNVIQGNAITLTLDSVTDDQPSVDHIEFYWSTNFVFNEGEITPLGTDNNSADGWSVSASTNPIPTGNVHYFVRAQDMDDQWGAPAHTTGEILPRPVLSFEPSQTNLVVPEGETAQFDVVLSIEPASAVTASVTRTAGQDDITVVSAATITFTTTNWDDPHTITIAAAEDPDVTSDVATITIQATSGPEIPPLVLVAQESDNDILAYEPIVTNIEVPENGSEILQVRLTMAPLAPVIATVIHESGDASLSVQSGLPLTFDDANWSEYQDIVIHAVSDDDAVNGQAVFRIETQSGAAVESRTFTAVEMDDGELTFAASPDPLVVYEGGAQVQLSVHLTADPVQPTEVSATLAGMDPELSIISGGTLSFTSENWSDDQLVTLEAINDGDALNDNDTLTLTTISGAAVTDLAISVVTMDADVPMGSVTIQVDPDGLQPNWTLTGPSGIPESGNEDTTFDSLQVGPYTISWEQLLGWVAPNPSVDQFDLADGDNIVLEGNYSVAAPAPTEATDILEDQGQYIRLTFTRCGYDMNNNGFPTTPVIGYNIHRLVEDAALVQAISTRGTIVEPGNFALTLSGQDEQVWIPSSSCSFAVTYNDRLFITSENRDIPTGTWEVVGAVFADQSDQYTVAAPTVVDGVPATFSVSAHTTDPGLFYWGEGLSATSIDNIVPQPASGFVVSWNQESQQASLEWQPSEASDLSHYNIYRSNSEEFSPAESNRVQSTTAASWTDTSDDCWGSYYLLTVVDDGGNESEFVAPSEASGTGSQNLSTAFVLHAAYPNPFNPQTTIAFELRNPGMVRLDIFTIDGKLVTGLVHGDKAAGRHQVIWQGQNSKGERVSSGAYFYRLQAGDRTETKRMTLVK